jgi:hypothetical protein
MTSMIFTNCIGEKFFSKRKTHLRLDTQESQNNELERWQ